MLLLLIQFAFAASDPNPCTDKNQAGDLCNSLEGEPGVCMPCGGALICDLDDGDSEEAGCEEVDTGGDGKEEDGCGCSGGGLAPGLVASVSALLAFRRRRSGSPR